MQLLKRKTKENNNVEIPQVVLKDTYDKTLTTFPEDVILDLRRMVTRIDRVDGLPARLALISALPGEGVTYISRALAATISNDMDRSVCIVELNWWSPSSFVEPVNGGLAAVLKGESSLDEEIVDLGWNKLSVLPSGDIGRLDRPIMARSKNLKETIFKLGERFDHLIMDVPAIRLTSDAVPIASLGNACCVIIQQGVTTIEDVKRSLDEIDHLSILGVVLNQVKINTPQKLMNLVPN